MNRGRARAEVIGQRQSTAPGLGCDRSFQGAQQWGGITIGDWEHGNFRQIWRFRLWQPLGVFRGAHSWGERVARVEGEVANRAALGAVLVAPRTGRVSVPL